MKPLRALYVDLNSFFASCEQQENPSLRGKPVAVVPLLSDTTSVIAASYEAKAFGVKTGVRVSDAKKMCPNLTLISARHGPYVHYHHKVREAIDLVLPIHSVCSIDEFACELTGSQQTPEKALSLGYKIKEIIHEQVGAEIHCSIGISMNFLLAKMACDMKKPNGLTLLDEQNRITMLSKLNLQDVPGIGRRMHQRLTNKGIRSLFELLQKSERETRGLWGSILGSRYHRLLQGEWLSPAPSSETKSISHQHVLPPQDRSLIRGLTVAQKLLWKAAIRLRAEGFLAHRIGLSVRFLSGEKEFIEKRIEPTQDSSEFLHHLNEMYRNIFKQKSKNTKPIKIAVFLSDFTKEGQEQLSLFQQLQERPQKPSVFKTVDAINEKFGRNTIYVGSLHEKLESAPTRIAFSRIPELKEVE